MYLYIYIYIYSCIYYKCIYSCGSIMLQHFIEKNRFQKLWNCRLDQSFFLRIPSMIGPAQPVMLITLETSQRTVLFLYMHAPRPSKYI